MPTFSDPVNDLRPTQKPFHERLSKLLFFQWCNFDPEQTRPELGLYKCNQNKLQVLSNAALFAATDLFAGTGFRHPDQSLVFIDVS